MIRTLTKQGNSLALVFDKTLRDLLEIGADTPLHLQVQGRTLTIIPMTDAEREAKFVKALADVNRQYAPALQKLAKR